MPSASFNQRDHRAGAGRARVGRIDIDPATRRLIDSGAEPLLGQFLRTWESLVAAKGRYPSRNEIDPAALGAKLLPNVFLVDVVDTPGLSAPRFRFRLLGQAIIEREPTRAGAFVDQIGATADIVGIEHHYIGALEGKVWIREASLAWSDPRGGYLRYRVMMLPLSEDGETVTHLIGLALYAF
ncbi:PAS domain-containing protein [Dongia sp. agr-C8]